MRYNPLIFPKSLFFNLSLCKLAQRPKVVHSCFFLSNTRRGTFSQNREGEDGNAKHKRVLLVYS